MLTQQPSSSDGSPSKRGMLTQESSNSNSVPSKGGPLTDQPSPNGNAPSQRLAELLRCSHDRALRAKKSQSNTEGIRLYDNRDEETQCCSNERTTQQSSRSSASVLSLPRHPIFPSQLTEGGSSEEHKWTLDSQRMEASQKLVEPNQDEGSDPLQLHYWKGLASRSKQKELPFRNALANIVIAKNHHSTQQPQQHGGLLWLPSILAGEMGPSEIAGILRRPRDPKP